MKAMVWTGYGPPDVLELQGVDKLEDENREGLT
jgi:hypothetical protein